MTRRMTHALMRWVVSSVICFAAAVTAHAGTSIAGSGGLTIVVDGAGDVSSVRWPSPGYCEQLTRGPVDQETVPRGMMWGIASSGGVRWLDTLEHPVVTVSTDDPFEIVVSGGLPPGSGRAEYRYMVVPSQDILVVTCTVWDEVKPESLVFYADFSPALHVPAELPLSRYPFGRIDDFAAFVSTPSTVVHFRPHDAGQRHYDDARKASYTRSSVLGDPWPAFKAGVWIAYSSPEPVVDARVGDERGAPDQTAVSGFCDSQMRIIPTDRDGGYTASVVVAFSATQKNAQRVLTESLSTGVAQLRENASNWWKARWAAVRFPTSASPEVIDAAKHSVIALTSAVDASSGAVVQFRPGSPWALNRTEDSVWAVPALCRMGFADAAAQHMNFYAGALPESESPGPIPGLLYANGALALPRVVVDMSSSSWYLWACRQYASALDHESQKAWLLSAWESIETVADAIDAWKNPRTGEPLPSYDASMRRDVRSDKAVLDMHMGLACATWAAERVGKRADKWRLTMQGFNDVLRRRMLNDRGEWNSPDLWPPYDSGVFPPNDPRWLDVLAKLTERLGSLEAGDAVHALSIGVEIAHRMNADMTALRQMAPDIVARTLTPDATDNPPRAALDSRMAAQLYLALMHLDVQ